jgi:hypothetical protein
MFAPQRWPSVGANQHSIHADSAPVVTCLVLTAGMYSESFQVQLQHLCDAVLCEQSLADNSDIYRLLPDPTRWAAGVNRVCYVCMLCCAMLCCCFMDHFCIRCSPDSLGMT